MTEAAGGGGLEMVARRHSSTRMGLEAPIGQAPFTGRTECGLHCTLGAVSAARSAHGAARRRRTAFTVSRCEEAPFTLSAMNRARSGTVSEARSAFGAVRRRLTAFTVSRCEETPFTPLCYE